ncbi:MAG: hypothetical protein J2P50_16470 [Hyphomicrobiaceae bacterium]|nr:hypothetical protein [Hyphomicrobiaceae bacterium]
MALVSVAGLLALLDLQLLQSPVDIAPIAAPILSADAPRPESLEPATPLDKMSAEQFREMVGRPLFNPSRRPVQRNEAAAGQPKAASSKMRLIGVMKGEDRPPQALIRLGDDPRGKWITEGAELDGWKLSKVNDLSVILEAGGRSRELKLLIPRHTSPPSPVPKAEH